MSPHDSGRAAAARAAHDEPLPAPVLTVAAIIERNGRFLVVEEIAHGRRVFNQPAGHVEPGESIVDAAIRETLEETGWTFAPLAVSGIYYWCRPGQSRGYLRTAFVGHATRREPGRRLDDGILRTLWLTREELCRRSARLRSPMVMRGIDDYLRGSRQAIASIRNLDATGLMERAHSL
jgi:8-oxo-dGTP pyrophosphatase MutT (NUDIX family)